MTTENETARTRQAKTERFGLGTCLVQISLEHYLTQLEHLDGRISQADILESVAYVFRNEVRTQLNHKAAIHKAKQLECTPIVCVAQDNRKGRPLEDPILIRKMLELFDSKPEHLTGLLPFVPGMSIILTQNIAIELRLINGVNGIFRRLVYQGVI